MVNFKSPQNEKLEENEACFCIKIFCIVNIHIVISGFWLQTSEHSLRHCWDLFWSLSLDTCEITNAKHPRRQEFQKVIMCSPFNLIACWISDFPFLKAFWWKILFVNVLVTPTDYNMHYLHIDCISCLSCSSRRAYWMLVWESWTWTLNTEGTLGRTVLDAETSFMSQECWVLWSVF